MFFGGGIGCLAASIQLKNVVLCFQWVIILQRDDSEETRTFWKPAAAIHWVCFKTRILQNPLAETDISRTSFSMKMTRACQGKTPTSCKGLVAICEAGVPPAASLVLGIDRARTATKKCCGNSQMIGLREQLQENPIFHGKIYGFL